MPKLSANSNIRITTIAPHSMTGNNSPKADKPHNKWATKKSISPAEKSNDLSLDVGSTVKPRLNISVRPNRNTNVQNSEILMGSHNLRSEDMMLESVTPMNHPRRNFALAQSPAMSPKNDATMSTGASSQFGGILA